MNLTLNNRSQKIESKMEDIINISDEIVNQFIESNKMNINIEYLNPDPGFFEAVSQASYTKYKEIFNEVGDDAINYNTILLKILQKIHKVNITLKTEAKSPDISIISINIKDTKNKEINIIKASTGTVNSRKSVNFLCLLIIANLFPFFCKMLTYKLFQNQNFKDSGLSIHKSEKSQFNSFNSDQIQPIRDTGVKHNILSELEKSTFDINHLALTKDSSNNRYGFGQLSNRDPKENSFNLPKNGQFSRPISIFGGSNGVNLPNQTHPNDLASNNIISSKNQNKNNDKNKKIISRIFGNNVEWDLVEYLKGNLIFSPQQQDEITDFDSLRQVKLIDILSKKVQKLKSKSLSIQNKCENSTYTTTLMIDNDVLCKVVVRCANKIISKEISALIFIEDNFKKIYDQIANFFHIEDKEDSNRSDIIISEKTDNNFLQIVQKFWKNFFNEADFTFGIIDVDDTTWIKWSDLSFLKPENIQIYNPQNFYNLSELMKINGLKLDLTLTCLSKFQITYKISSFSGHNETEIGLTIETSKLDLAIIVSETKLVELLFPNYFETFVISQKNNNEEFNETIDNFCRRFSCQVVEIHKQGQLQGIDIQKYTSMLESIIQDYISADEKFNFIQILVDLLSANRYQLDIQNKTIESKPDSKLFQIDLSIENFTFASYSISAKYKDDAQRLAALIVLLVNFPSIMMIIN
jgi:hypothetical protein